MDNLEPVTGSWLVGIIKHLGFGAYKTLSSLAKDKCIL